MDINLQAWLLALLAGLTVAVLIGSIIIILLIIFILRRIQKIADRADSMTEGLPDFVRTISKRIAPMALTTILGAVLNKVRRRKN